MRKNNDFGKMISDKLTNLDESPKDFIWDSIESNLDKKKDRKLIYFSLPILLSGILIGYLLSSTTLDSNTANKVVEKVKTPNNNLEKANNTTVVFEKDSLIKPSKEIISSSKTIIKETETYSIIEECLTYKIVKAKQNDLTNEKNLPVNIAVVGITSKKKENNLKLEQKNLTLEKHTPANATVVETTSKEKESNIIVSSKNKPIISNIKNEKTKTSNSTTDSLFENKDNYVANSEIVNPKMKPPIVSKNEITTDSTLVTSNEVVEENKKIKKTASKSNKKKKQKKSNEKFLVSAFYGPSVFGTLKEGSSINNSFDNYKKSHPITSTYGFYFRTMFNKIGFRAGLSVQHLSYITEMNDNTISNYSNIELNDNLSSTILENSFAGNSAIKLKQDFTYYEMPIEIYYDITNEESKFGTSVFGGIIPQYLKDNQLYLSSNETDAINFGTTKNQTKVNVTLDVGVGFHYKVTKKIFLNVDPILKFQTNPYKTNTNFKPYSFSIQSGITYKIN